MASSSQIPFGPLGDTITFTAVTPTPPTGLQAPVHPTTNTSAGQFRIINDSTVTVFLGVGATSVAAIANAGAVATSIPLLPGTDEVLRFSPDAFFTGKSASGAATIYITPGQGL
jgi:hypothetical protein|tara:strand:- start:201 stop:542 length:342 start_codon:yes stop_codon:yes gene_type:complete